MVPSIKILRKDFVQPSFPTPASLSELKFSGLDQIFGVVDIPLVMFFENQPSSRIDSAHRSRLLKQSLSHTLTKFYPFAGRMNGYDSVICNDSGALYVEAQVDATLLEAIQDDIANQVNQYLPLDPFHSDTSSDGVPLAVQISRFRCGGMAIGFCLSHRVGDAWTQAMFLKSWGAACRGEMEKVVEPKFGLGYNIFPPLYPRLASPGSGTGLTSEEMTGKKMVMKRFFFSNEKIAELKRLATCSGSKEQSPTRVEVMFAFIWKQIVDGIIKSRDNHRSTFVAKLLVNLRPRFGPPIGDLAMGNFIIMKPALSTTGKATDFGLLVSQFQDARERIRNTKEAVDFGNYFRELGEAINKPHAWGCTFSSVFSFPFNETDYGWGKALEVYLAPVRRPIVFLLRTKYRDGIEAWINLAEDDMSMLPDELLLLEIKTEFSAKHTPSRL